MGHHGGTRFDIVIIGKGKSETGKSLGKTVHELRRVGPNAEPF